MKYARKKISNESNFTSVEEFDFKDLYDKTVEAPFQCVEETKKYFVLQTMA